MTDTERAELKRLAEAATQGKWKASSVYVFIETEDGELLDLADCSEKRKRAKENALFIAAANPAAVLDLLADVDAVAASEDSRAEEVRRHAETKRLLEEAIAENERLKAEVRAALNKHRFTAKTTEADAVNEVLVSIARDLHIAHED